MRTRLIPLLPILVLPTVVVAQQPPPIYVAPVVPPAFLLLSDPGVRKEIALTADQKAAADKVRQDWSIPARGLHLGQFGLVPAAALRAAANERTAGFLASELTKEQRTRLNQILFQLREKEFGPHQALAMAARDLGLRPDQVEDVRTLKALRVEEIDKAVTSGKRFERVKLEVQASNGDTFDKMAEMLTRAQRERLKEMRGKAFEGKVEMVVLPPEAKRARYPAPQFGLYDLELWYASALAVDLNVSDEKRQSLQRALHAEEGIVTYRVRAGSEEKVHATVEKALTDFLTLEQRARFDQIMMQRRARVSPEAVCSYPAAVSALKLTPIQLRDLAAGGALADVLTRDQIDKHRQLLGEPHALPVLNDAYVPLIDPGLAGYRPHAQARDFLRVSDRLGLSAEQMKKLRELAEDEPKFRELIHKELSLEDTPPVAGSGRALTAENAVTERYRDAVEQQCWDTLDPAQQSIARKLFGRGRK